MQAFFESLWYILFYLCLFFSCYYILLAIVGILYHKQKYRIRNDEQSFCIFVPCHNEAAVIGATVDNLAKINYNENLFEIYFIADNCKDSTAEKIKASIERSGKRNFYVLERNENEAKKRGKPHAIRWGIELLSQDTSFYDKYDMFMILDADNFVDADILKHINSQYLSYPENNRPVMIQSYLDSKNKNSLIARAYFIAYRLTNGFFQLSRHTLGLVPAIGGTGFAVTNEFLKSIGGYSCTSLVEDLELQTIATLHGKRIVYNHQARIYDEKPTGIKQSAIQRTRWAQGHWYIFFKYFGKIFKKIFDPREVSQIHKRVDMLIYLSSMAFLLFSLLYALVSLVMWFMGISIPSSGWMIVILWMGIFSILLFPISSLFDGSAEEKRRVFLDFIPNMFSNTLLMGICMYANIAGLLRCRNQTVWRKTAHNVTAMKEDQKEKEATKRKYS